jgi:hypothetical protein
VAPQPFAEGAMRYAFFMKETFQIPKQKQPEQNFYVGKIPKDLRPAYYNLDQMKNDIETIFICSHIVKEFNDRLLESNWLDS